MLSATCPGLFQMTFFSSVRFLLSSFLKPGRQSSLLGINYTQDIKISGNSPQCLGNTGFK